MFAAVFARARSAAQRRAALEGGDRVRVLPPGCLFLPPSRIGASDDVFSGNRTRLEVMEFCRRRSSAQSSSSAAAGSSVGTDRAEGRRWILAEQMDPARRGRDLQGWRQTFSEREHIASPRARGSRCGASPLAGALTVAPLRVQLYDATPTGAARPAYERARVCAAVSQSSPAGQALVNHRLRRDRRAAA